MSKFSIYIFLGFICIYRFSKYCYRIYEILVYWQDAIDDGYRLLIQFVMFGEFYDNDTQRVIYWSFIVLCCYSCLVYLFAENMCEYFAPLATLVYYLIAEHSFNFVKTKMWCLRKQIISLISLKYISTAFSNSRISVILLVGVINYN